MSSHLSPSASPESIASHDVTKTEAVALAVLLIIALGLRVASIFQFHFNSDEPQHLHVAWAWTQGLVQYRDIFDNHTPLFHLLSAPFVALIGENANILIYMRLILLVPFAIVLLQVYRLSRPFFGVSIAWWTTVLFALFPAAFFRTLEYRPLILWLVLWLGVLLVLVGGRFTMRRAVVVGLLLGLNILVSLKTILMLAALGLGAAALPLVAPNVRAAYRPRLWLGPLGACLGAMALPPLALVAAYAAIGALGSMLYCTVFHNIVPGQGTWGHPEIALGLPLGLIGLVVMGRWLYRRESAPVRDGRILFLLMVTGSYLSLLAVWPLVTNQTVVPIYPVGLILIVGIPFTNRPLGADVPADKAPSAKKGPLYVPIVAVLVEIAIIMPGAKLWQHDTGRESRYVAAILHVTHPSDYVLDQKGESIFRRRPFYYVFETITRERLELGLIKDTIAQRLIATHTPVVVNPDRHFPAKANAFIRRNYVHVGPFRVLGKVLGCRGAGHGRTFDFEIRIPAHYAILVSAGKVRGRLDGKVYRGPRLLKAGKHTFAATSGTGAVSVIWARAAGLGYRPIIKKPCRADSPATRPMVSTPRGGRT